MIALRPYLPTDAPVLADLFRRSILELAIEDYDEAQCEAWAALADDEQAFAARLAGGLTLLGLSNGTVAGFISLKGQTEIDLLYVDPRFVRQKVASQLCEALETILAARGADFIETQASDQALPFFKYRGYEPRQRNTKVIGSQWLGSTTMRKDLVGTAKKTQAGPSSSSLARH
jgi:putative acetyltransferase